MNKSIHQHCKQARKEHHLLLNDLAYILNIDQGNLSSFEAGKIPHPKALTGYHILFNLSTQSIIPQVFNAGCKPYLDRCFQLAEKIDEQSPNTLKNRNRLEGLDTVITHLMELSNDGQ